ncbi:hypothetical protein NW759_015336 [Fusarium solani]|nr:hypothetical protein NW759_015336 [Fusarium solani]
MRCATLAGLALLGGVAHAASVDTIGGMEIVPVNVLWKRSTFLSSNIKCNVNTWANCYYIDKGIEYLRKVKGKPVNDPGKCGRVSCSYNSGIFGCNTSSGRKTLNSFGSVADGAQAASNKCYDPNGNFCWVRGRATHTTNWYVLVTGQTC